jgi:radical SAM superfamily enzyme YgiQ (UPF0313 family)
LVTKACEGGVLFVMAPNGFSHAFPESMGAAFLRAVLARGGIPSGTYQPDRSPGQAAFVSHLRSLRPAVVGFTVYESNLRLTRDLVRLARKALPDAFILAGGPNATFAPEETLRLLDADACLRGAGEGRIRPLAERVRAEAPRSRALVDALREVPNLVLRTGDDLQATRLEDLSSFPGPPYRTLDDLPSPWQEGLVSHPSVGYLTARGCNQACTYCSFAAISGHRVHFHSVERVLDDLEAIQRLGEGTPRVPVFDDAFTLVPDRARRICEGILERGLRLDLRGDTRADRVDEALLKLMARAGFTTVSFGVESAVPGILRAIGKVRPPEAPGTDLEAEKAFLESVRRAVAWAREAGLTPKVSVMGGLPFETAEDFRTTLAFVESLRLPAYAHNILTVMPGTPLFETQARAGLSAARDPGTLRWVTTHAYDPGQVRPLPGASCLGSAWEEANLLADALCGRPLAAGRAEGAAWAVVLHGLAPTGELRAWLASILTIGGAVVVLGEDPDPPDREAWSRWLDHGGAAAGSRIVLGRADAEGWRAASGRHATHRVRLARTWDPGQALEPLRWDREGGCAFTVFIASDPAVHADGEWGPVPAFGPGLQIADACRWRGGEPRCRAPQVLHVGPDGSVRPCWHGPRVGSVGDAWAGIEKTCRDLPGACPLAEPGGDPWPNLRELDLASQLAWLFQPS